MKFNDISYNPVYSNYYHFNINQQKILLMKCFTYFSYTKSSKNQHFEQDFQVMIT